MLLLLYIRLGHYKFVSCSITVGVQLVLREYHFTTQPTFTEEDIFNLLPIIRIAQFKVNYYIIEYSPPPQLPCSGKFWWEKTLVNLAICYEFAKVLYVNCLKKLELGLKFAKAFFAKCNLACYLPKFSPAKIFCYTVYCILVHIVIITAI